ncbi:MAG: hypothetical protein ACK44B_10935 [Flavobacteriales bacterium]
MTPSELNQFLNTPKKNVTELLKTNTPNYGAILFAGIAVGAVIYAFYLYQENEELRSRMTKGE